MLFCAPAPALPTVAQFASGRILSIPSSLHLSYTTSNYTAPQQLASKLTLEWMSRFVITHKCHWAGGAWALPLTSLSSQGRAVQPPSSPASGVVL